MMSKRNIGQEILYGIREIKTFKAGKKTLKTRALREPSSPQIINKTEQINVSEQAYLKILDLLDNPPEPTNALRSAMKAHQTAKM